MGLAAVTLLYVMGGWTRGRAASQWPWCSLFLALLSCSIDSTSMTCETPTSSPCHPGGVRRAPLVASPGLRSPRLLCFFSLAPTDPLLGTLDVHPQCVGDLWLCHVLHSVILGYLRVGLQSSLNVHVGHIANMTSTSRVIVIKSFEQFQRRPSSLIGFAFMLIIVKHINLYEILLLNVLILSGSLARMKGIVRCRRLISGRLLFGRTF